MNHHVFIGQSLSDPTQFYTDLCTDIDARLAAHNAGQPPHTAKLEPWRLLSSHYFIDPNVAAAFELHLTSGSGRAFAAKRLRATKAALIPQTHKGSGGAFRHRRYPCTIEKA